MTLLEPVAFNRQRDQQSSFRPRSSSLALRPGNLFVRMAVMRVIGQVTGRSSADIVARHWPSDRIMAELVERAATSPAVTTVTGWAAELAQKVTADAVEALGPASAAAQLIREGLVLNFNGARQIMVPGLIADPNYASFVAEGQPIPVRQLNAAGPTLIPYKIGSIVVLTREMVESSNAEALIGDALVRSAGLALDAAFFDSNAASAARPAGIRNGIAALTASNDSNAIEAVLADFSTLVGSVSAVGGGGPFILVARAGRAVTMNSRFYRQFDRESGLIQVLPSATVGADLVAVAPAALVAAISADPDIETAKAATLHEDSSPQPLMVAGPARSLWQTDSIALKVRWPATWALRDPRGVAWLTPSWN